MNNLSHKLVPANDIQGASLEALQPLTSPAKVTYEIFFGATLEELESEVNNALDHGWQLQGGVCSEPLGDFMQAMVKQEVIQ